MEAEPGADARRRKEGAPGGGGGGLEWEVERQYDDFERELVLMAAAAPGAERRQQPKQKQPRSRPLAADLLQNCDLPPPAKLFGPVPTLQRLESAAAAAADHRKGDATGGGGNDSLLRALRLSQWRAQEAEEKLAAAGAAAGGLAALLVRDSVALSAHRRWVMMLEAENSRLRVRDGGGAEPGPDDGGAAPRGAGVAAW